MGAAQEMFRISPLVERLKRKTARLRGEIAAVGLAYRDPRVPWHAKAVALLVVAYALSPLDLIPDFIPVLGYLDDLILLPIGVRLALKLIPPEILAECRERVRSAPSPMPRNVRWVAAGAVLAVWLLMFGWIVGRVL